MRILRTYNFQLSTILSKIPSKRTLRTLSIFSNAYQLDKHQYITPTLGRTLLFFVLLSSLSFGKIFSQEESIPEDILGEHLLKGSFYQENYDKFNHHTCEIVLTTNLSFAKKTGSSSKPFPGTKIFKSKITIYSSWYEQQAKDLLDFYAKHASTENFMKPSRARPSWKLFLCKAFGSELKEALNGEEYRDKDKLIEHIKDRYIESSLHYAAKYRLQKKVKKAPKVGSLVKSMQPLMASFIYGDGWIAIAECYRTSPRSKKTKELYRNFFCSHEVMMQLRRLYHLKVAESALDASLLQLDDRHFIAYHRASVRIWRSKKQYLFSDYEKMKEVDELPEHLKGPEIKSHMP